MPGPASGSASCSRPPGDDPPLRIECLSPPSPVREPTPRITSGSVPYRRLDVPGLDRRGLRCAAAVEARRQQASQAMSSRSSSTVTPIWRGRAAAGRRPTRGSQQCVMVHLLRATPGPNPGTNYDGGDRVNCARTERRGAGGPHVSSMPARFARGWRCLAALLRNGAAQS